MIVSSRLTCQNQIKVFIIFLSTAHAQVDTKTEKKLTCRYAIANQ